MVGIMPKALVWKISFDSTESRSNWDSVLYQKKIMSLNPVTLSDTAWDIRFPHCTRPINILLISFNKHELEVNAVGMFDSLLF